MLRSRFAKLFNKVVNRVTITAVLVLVQIGWLLLAYMRLSEYAAWIDVAMTIISLLIGLYLVRKDEDSGYKITWLVVIGTLPILGGLLYIFYGNKRPSRRMRARMDKVNKSHTDDMIQPEGQTDQLDERMRALSHYVSQYGPYPAWTGTQTEYFCCGEDMFPRLLEDLEKAEKFIFVEFFIIKPGKMWSAVVEILKRKAAEGVDVRLIYDDFGTINTPSDFLIDLERNHIRCIPFNPVVPLITLVMNHRDHRKIFSIDGNIGYTGGVNLADEYINEEERFGYWKDTAVRLEGAAVWNLTVMFLNFWNSFRPVDEKYDIFRPTVQLPTDGVIQPYADSPLDDETLAKNVYRDILNQARHYVYIFTPYLGIGEDMMNCIKLAARRGVDVRIVVPGIPDKKMVYRLTRSYYAPLLNAGVRIYEYTPGFLHAKNYVSDGVIATVGSINMDYRSLYLHFECGVLLMNNSKIAEIEADAKNTIAQSREVSLKDCRRGFIGSVIDSTLRLFSPLI